MTATGIPPMHIELAWPSLWPFLQRALVHSDEKPAPAEILASIRANSLQGWLIYERNIPVAGICTKLIRDRTSGELHGHLWLIGGSRLHSWSADFFSKFIPWARSEGCCAITACGRKGWGRWAERYDFRRIEDRNGM